MSKSKQKKENMKRIELTTGALGCAIVLGLATPVTAQIYNIDFTATDGSTVTATGSINVSGGVATSGTLTLAGLGWVTFPGTYSLNTDYSRPAGNYPELNTSVGYASPNIYGNFDNLFSSTSPHIDSAGLLFTVSVPNQTIYGGIGTLNEEVFLTYDGGGQYGLWDDFNGPYSALGVGADQSPNNNYEFTGTLNASAVPEPTTLISGAMLLLPFGASTLRKLRKNRTA
jgi:hypothetical protein